jgi:transposase-like protein
MDALGLMERGDYSSAIRRMRTAIEVIVADRLEKILTEKHGWKFAKRFLRETKMKFDERLARLCSETGLIINDHFKMVLSKITNLRIKIVHYGHRVSFAEKGEAQMLIDNGRWLYNQIENDQNRFKVRESNIASRSLGRFRTLFNASLGAEGVHVEKPPQI